MSSLTEGIKTKGEINGNGYPFELGVRRAGYGQFLIHHFHLRRYKSEMRFIQQTSGEPCFLNEGGVVVYFFRQSANYEYLSLLGIGILSESDL